MATQILPPRLPLSGQPSKVSHLQRKISFEIFALGLIILLCAALRLYHLGAASLWSDEIFSRYYADVFGLRYLVTGGLSLERPILPPTISYSMAGAPCGVAVKQRYGRYLLWRARFAFQLPICLVASWRGSRRACSLLFSSRFARPACISLKRRGSTPSSCWLHRSCYGPPPSSSATRAQ